MELKYAYAYIRVSTDRQEELSPDSQEKLIREYASKNNILILEVFSEIGISGRKADKRPEFQRMIGAAKSPEHPVDYILVWKFSRFARNQEESIVYKSLLKKQNHVDVVSISEPLIDGPFGSLIERIIEWMDEYYSIRLSGEVLRGMKEKAQRGGYQISPCLGYRAVGEGKPFEIDEEEYKIVSYIFDQYDNYNYDFTKIARKLNEAGCLTRRGLPFEQRSIERILTNPFYCGLVRWNDQEFMGTHETRLTKERYDERMQKLNSRRKTYKQRDVSSCKHWLSGLLKCGKCGATLAYSKSNKRTSYFQCWKYSKGLHKESMSISETKVVNAVYEYLEGILSGADFDYEYQPVETIETVSEREALKEELDRIASRERRIRLAFENEVDTLEEYKENKERLKKAREDVQRQLDELDSVDTSAEHLPSKADVLAKVHTVYDIIKDPDVDYDIKGTLLRGLLNEIIYDKDNGKLIFHLYIS